MKKHMRIWTFLLAMLMSLTLLTAQAESALPSEVADLFTVKGGHTTPSRTSQICRRTRRSR